MKRRRRWNRRDRHGELKTPRVLIVAPSLDIVGGQSVQAACLLKRLRTEPSVKVGFLPHNPRLPMPLRLLQKIKYVRTIVTSLVYVAMLLARVWRYDVVHVFSASYFSFLLAPLPAMLAAKLYGAKIVLNYHSGEAEDHLMHWQTAVPTIGLADVIAVPSAYLVDIFARFGLQARAISNIVELDNFRFRSRRPVRPVFLTSRLLESHYNLPCVLKAFAIIQRHHPEARLTIAGDGSRRAEIEGLAKKLELRDVVFAGCVPPGEMPMFYSEADVLLNGSNVDNMPISIIEAFAAGLPVVTSDAGGIPYIVAHEQTGLLVRRGDHEAMARAAMRLLDDEEFAYEIASRACAACQKYTWTEVRRDWLNLYCDLAGDRALEPQRNMVNDEAAVSEGSSFKI